MRFHRFRHHFRHLPRINPPRNNRTNQHKQQKHRKIFHCTFLIFSHYLLLIYILDFPFLIFQLKKQIPTHTQTTNVLKNKPSMIQTFYNCKTANASLLRPYISVHFTFFTHSLKSVNTLFHHFTDNPATTANSIPVPIFSPPT